MSQKKLTIKFTAKNLRAVSERQAQETAPCLNAESDSKSELVLDVPEAKRSRRDQVLDMVKFPSTTVTENMSQKKLTIKFTAKNLRVVSERQTQETAPCLKVGSDSKSELDLDVPEGKRRRMVKVKFPRMILTEKMSQKKSNIKFTGKNLRVVSERQAQETAPCLNAESDLKLKQPGISNKRKSDLVLDVREGKRRKMDQFVKRHCSIILKELLSHRAAQIFSRPVDPVVLCIPDYFSVISHPMDLGTIRSKLEENLYFSSEEFAADVCLTFSNAMLYNPPNSLAHQYARELDRYFKRRWKYQLASRNHQNKGVVHNGIGLKTQDNADFSKKLKSDIASGSKNSTAVEEKNGLRKEVMVMLRSLKSSEKLPELLQRFNLKERSLGQNIRALGVSALKEFKGALKSFSDSNCANSMPTKTKVNRLDSLSGKDVVKGGACSLVNSKQSVSSVSPLCGLCRDVPRQCRHQNSEVPTSSNERESKEANHGTDTKSGDSEGKVISTHRSVSARDSDGFSPHMDEESLKKALRVEKLKSRFADIIMKANNGDKADPRKMQQERELLERLQKEEAARIDAQKREQKMIIERKREAARIALEEMERTIVVEDNFTDLRELERLRKCSVADFNHAFGVKIDKQTYQFRRPVELLGLVLKKEDEESDEEPFLNGTREEGEILE